MIFIFWWCITRDSLKQQKVFFFLLTVANKVCEHDLFLANAAASVTHLVLDIVLALEHAAGQGLLEPLELALHVLLGSLGRALHSTHIG